MYGKEISDLRNKLNEANALIEKFKEYKHSMQENLKKSLLRGVTAMNLEAMTILEPESSNYMLGHTSQMNNLGDNVFASQISEIDKHSNNLINQSANFNLNNMHDPFSDRDYKATTNINKNQIDSPGGKNKPNTSIYNIENQSYVSEVVEKKVYLFIFL